MALLACSRSYWQASGAAQESIGEVAETQQVIQRADQFRSRWRFAGVLEVGPFGGDQRLAAVRQNQHELQASGHAGLPKDL
jgi:hypothetical protein